MGVTHAEHYWTWKRKTGDLERLCTGAASTSKTAITITIEQRGKKMANQMSRKEMLRQQHGTILTELARLESLPDEPETDPGMIYFTKSFGKDKRLTTTRVYTYAAVKADNDLWYITGRRAMIGLSWDELVEYIFGEGDDKTSVWVVTAMEELN